MCKYLKMLGVICITLSNECYMQKKEQSYLQVTIYWYELKEELLKYASGPAHVNVIKECVLPIFYDAMAIDCVTEGLVPGPIAPVSTIWLILAKLKEDYNMGVQGAFFRGRIHSEKCYASVVASLQGIVSRHISSYPSISCKRIRS